MRTTTLTSMMLLAWTSTIGACSEGAQPETTTFESFGSAGSTGDEDDGGPSEGDPGDESPDPGDDGAGDGDGEPGDDGDDDDDGRSPGDGHGDGDGEGDGQPGDGDPSEGDSGAGNQSIPCDVPEAELVMLVPHLVLVLDKSGSMVQNTWDHDANPQTPKITRWNSLHNVVKSVVENFDDQFEFGAQLFPSTSATNDYNLNACLINSPPEVPVAPHNAAGVLLGIPIGTTHNIRGGTPATAGMSSAIDHLLDIDDGDPAAIVLVTDGAANCRTDAVDEFDRFETYDPNLLPLVAEAYADLQIPTYVVGIDISNQVTPITGANDHPPDGEPDGISPFAQLNELAVAGGKPLAGPADFYQTQNEIELQAALQAIVDDAISCTLILDPLPAFPELIEVIMDGEQVPKVGDCASEDGWVFSDPDGPYGSLELCGSYCAAIGDAQELTAEYYCNPG